MRDEMTVLSLSELLSGEPIPEQFAIQIGEQLIDSRLGPILSLTSPDPSSGESGRYCRYVARLQRTAMISDTGYPDIEIFSGAGSDERTAKLRAIGEAIERYCLSISKYDDYFTGQYSELDHPAINPEEMLAFSDTQIANKDFDRTDIRNAAYHWTATTRLTNGEKVFVPGQLVRLPFNTNLTVRQPVSHGAAAGTDITSALYRALCELVERECFAISYLNKLRCPKIDLEAVPSEHSRELKNELNLMGWQLTALDLSLDHPFQTCLVIGISDSNDTPMLNLGLNASDGMLSAIEGALREVFQFATQQPGKSAEDPLKSPNATVRTLDERKEFWDRQEMISELAFWLQSSPTRDETTIDSHCASKPKESIDKFITFLNENGLEAYVSDATTPDIREQGFRVVSVSIPSFHPLHLDEQFRYLGTSRLYEVPVQVGHLDYPQAECELNDTPHPFL